MKSILIILAILFCTQYITAQDKNSFVGVSVCSPCHKTEKQGKQLEIWEKSKHAEAFKTLQTARADSIAKALGHATPAAETVDCLKCHASGYNTEKTFIGEKFDVKDGVQCETCHGPGSNYKSLKIMKDRELSVKNGLIVHENKADFCAGCHNSQSPTFTGFDLNPMWEKIKHPVPTDK